MQDFLILSVGAEHTETGEIVGSGTSQMVRWLISYGQQGTVMRNQWV